MTLHICLLTSARIFEIAYGGDSKYSSSLVRYLLDRKYNVTLLASGFASIKSMTLSGNEEIVNTIPNGGKRKEIKKIRILNPPYTVYAFSRFIMSILWILKVLLLNRRCPINIIHAQDTGYSGLAAVISGRILRVPVILSSHGIRHKVIESYVTSKLKKIIVKMEYFLDIFTIKNADRVIVDNPSIKNYFEAKTSKTIDYVPVPIETKNFEFSPQSRDLIREELGIDEKDNVVGFVGRFVPVKNLLTLLTAFADLARIDTSLRLILVGTGQLEAELKEYVKKTSIDDRVIFCGARNDIDKMLSAFDIFVLPSYNEGMPLALLEAMACGRAIICSDIPATREVLTPEQDAIFFDPPYNAEKLGYYISLLSKDKDLRLKLGNSAKKRVSQYDEHVIFPKILRYYEMLSISREL